MIFCMVTAWTNAPVFSIFQASRSQHRLDVAMRLGEPSCWYRHGLAACYRPADSSRHTRVGSGVRREETGSV